MNEWLIIDKVCLFLFFSFYTTLDKKFIYFFFFDKNSFVFLMNLRVTKLYSLVFKQIIKFKR